MRSRRLSAKSRLGKKPEIMFSDVIAVNLNRFTAETVPDGAVRWNLGGVLQVHFGE